ncbi:poly(ADP-ribose) glycohydrolase-like [Daphnia pulicaria]|uniref:poly(ADP-ribose) glycohydrolase-like n=1 Tax=Daphnia pulicaria TaxID=35523 RepID=UPI001EEBAE34|nr:poly(ADP-ribose) glycohydrolase-like [Daphnia pulicaria]
MSDETPASPAKKKFKQMSIMDTMSNAGFTKKNSTESTPNNTDCAINMEPDECDVVIVEQSVIATVDTTIVTSVLGEQWAETEISSFKWKGKPLSEMYNLFDPECKQLHSIEPGRTHTVLFKVSTPYALGAIPEPYPANYSDRWDPEHVKMPCSPSNLYPISVNGNSTLEQRWKLIKEAFCGKQIRSSIELEKAILSYNSRYNNIWNFNRFHEFVDQKLTPNERKRFFDHILPGVIRLAIELPERVTGTPTLLTRNKSQSLSMSQSQISSLLANAFLSTYPRRNTQKRQSEFSTYPDINFIKLFENKSRSAAVYEKLKCLLNYFDRVITKEPSGVVTFTRQVVRDSEFPNWETASETFGGFHVSSEGTIEKEGIGLLQMDFANKFLGGGVLNWGCVQEEIRFVICPELIVGCLFSEVMESNEALVITGCEQYSCHSGYGDTFRFDGDFVDQTPRDAHGRRLCQVVAIDAIPFNRKETQYKKDSINRELRKAYAGFHCQRRIPLTAVATGNWGCGAFRGDPRLKCLIQLMAAAVTHRDVVYFTFDDNQLRDDVYNMYSLLVEKKATVGSLYTMLCDYGQQIGDSRSPSLDLYGYLYALLDSMDSEDGAADCSSSLSNTNNSAVESDFDVVMEKDK